MSLFESRKFFCYLISIIIIIVIISNWTEWSTIQGEIARRGYGVGIFKKLPMSVHVPFSNVGIPYPRSNHNEISSINP